jgi:hypothetical protein
VKDVDDVAVLQVAVRDFKIRDETEQRVTGLPPQIANRISRQARSSASRLHEGKRNQQDNWIPARTWPRS